MSAVMKSPFDSFVQQICANPQYLTVTNAQQLIESLRTAFPNLFAKVDEEGRKMAPKDLIRTTIDSLQDTIKRMNSAASSSTGGLDSTDLMRVANAQEKLIKIVSKLEQSLAANERQEALEMAIVEALESLGNKPLHDAYLKLFHLKLAEKSKKLANFT